MKVFLISNMYPTIKSPQYGIFVKNIEKSLSNYDINCGLKAVIYGKSRNIVIKILKYFILYLKIIFIGVFYKYDLIYAHFIGHTALPLILLKSIRNKKLVIHIHGSDIRVKFNAEEELKKLGIINKFARKIAKKADLLIVPSQYCLKIASELFQIEKDKFFISPSGGINPEIFFLDENKNQIRNTLGIKNKFIIGYISGLIPRKGFDTFLKAIKIIKDADHIEFYAIAIGPGLTENERKKIVENSNLQDKIIILDSLTQKELSKYLNAMDVFIFPTKMPESLGLIGIEAMACGVPVIGSRMGALVEYIKEGENGFLFNVNDENELVNKILLYYSYSVLVKKDFINSALTTSIQYHRNKIIYELKDRFLQLMYG